MNTCEQQLEHLLTFFIKVSLLSDRNGNKVFRVRHRKNGQDYVLRILKKQNDIYLTLCNGRCINLPAVYDVYSCSDGFIVLEEYIDGLTLDEVAQTGKYRKIGVKRILRQLCNAMQVLHQNGIVHRDIKPENVMVDKNGRIVLIDFSAARRISQKSHDTEVLGTIGYAPPEQFGLKESDERTDIYAAGVLLNVLLTGKHPAEKIANGHLGRVVAKCTSINPNDRYQTASQLKNSI